MGSNLGSANDHSNINTRIGGDILSLITCGMYVDPLAIYREYLQNAADSIASSNKPENEKVKIEIDLGRQCVTIRDSGPGLSHAQAQQELIPISKSCKHRQRDRGFRGIGRLAGLAFGDSVKYLTRRNTKTPVTQVVWDGGRLRNGIDNGLSAEETILQCVSTEKLKGNDYPANFFEVRVERITRHAISSILNRDAVREYLGEVCPVPLGADFPYASRVSDLFAENHPLFTLDVYLDGEKLPATRLHRNGVHFSEERVDEFTRFEEIMVPALGGDGHAAMGWIAHSSYLGAIPKALRIRCLRARVGNIQIGDETVFDHLFSENRFNRWCVAEIHILDPRIIPNGRRDYFEPSPHLRNLENHLGAVCRKLERQCRMASQKRNQRRHLESSLERLESAYDLLPPRYLPAPAARQFIKEKLLELADFRKRYEDIANTKEIGRLDRLEKKLQDFRAPPGRPSLFGIKSRDVPAYRKIFKTLIATSSSPKEAKKIIETILEDESN